MISFKSLFATFWVACVPVHSPVESGLCNILKIPVQQLSTKLVKFMHTSVCIKFMHITNIAASRRR